MWKRLVGMPRGEKGWYVLLYLVISFSWNGVRESELSCLFYPPLSRSTFSLLVWSTARSIFLPGSCSQPLKVPLSGSKDEVCDTEHQQEARGETYLCSAFVLSWEKKPLLKSRLLNLARVLTGLLPKNILNASEKEKRWLFETSHTQVCQRLTLKGESITLPLFDRLAPKAFFSVIIQSLNLQSGIFHQPRCGSALYPNACRSQRGPRVVSEHLEVSV